MVPLNDLQSYVILIPYIVLLYNNLMNPSAQNCNHRNFGVCIVFVFQLKQNGKRHKDRLIILKPAAKVRS